MCESGGWGVVQPIWCACSEATVCVPLEVCQSLRRQEVLGSLAHVCLHASHGRSSDCITCRTCHDVDARPRVRSDQGISYMRAPITCRVKRSVSCGQAGQ